MLRSVFPTHVGVFPAQERGSAGPRRLPHARGGVSRVESSSASTPAVFPTHVGVFPSRSIPSPPPLSLPHARGGVSGLTNSCPRIALSSPRTWGCFSGSGSWWCHARVFPTHVGVFPFLEKVPKIRKSLPHARGGVSAKLADIAKQRESSPRTWGCFQSPVVLHKVVGVFPTHVGVFLKRVAFSNAFNGLPHARGGVSNEDDAAEAEKMSSPRTWGCFISGLLICSLAQVFPTHVGVFPNLITGCMYIGSLPHARGGVSSHGLEPRLALESSPRTWGCFQRLAVLCLRVLVFPTHVGVFLWGMVIL